MSLDVGAVFGLLAAVFYGGYFLLTQQGRKSLDALTYFWVSGVSTTIALVIFNLVLGQPMWGFSSEAYLNLVALALVSQGVGTLAIVHAQGFLPATTVSTTLLGQPVVTALLAGLLLSERLTPLQFMGGAAVLLGVYIVHRSRATLAETDRGERQARKVCL